MKIALNMGSTTTMSTKATQAKVLERDLIAAKKGDWDAKNSLVRTFMPLMTSLAEKRTKEIAKVNELIDHGKEGLFKAVRKFNLKDGADKFNIFVVDFVEDAMDSGGNKGFWARLFGG